MRRAGTSKAQTAEGTPRAKKIKEEDQKVIVRSNGTVGYVGKDIAYHMWKFGLLGRDFGYRKFYRYPNQTTAGSQPPDGEPEHPHFGDVAEIYNVIDARQSEAQNTVIEALRGLGHDEAADHYTHFSYEMVALTPRCAAELGYQLSDEDKAEVVHRGLRPQRLWRESRRSADTLSSPRRERSRWRHPELSDAERACIATQIAIGALRYFMLKFTKPSVIAFDFKDALSFEGDTGPYAQYAVVRAQYFPQRWIRSRDVFTDDAAKNTSLRKSWQNTLTASLATTSGNSGWRPRRRLTL
jgi:arginyl-tRNA synthetase